MSSDDLSIRDIPDWINAVNRADTPLLRSLGVEVVKVGEKDKFGRTLLGYTEIDTAEKARLQQLSAEYRKKLNSAYKSGEFELIEREDDYGPYEEWVPIATDETRFLENEMNRYTREASSMIPEPIWDRELTEEEKRPKKVEWGFWKIAEE